MPTYEYRCPNGHDFEHFFRKISDATAELACPVCGAVGVRRVSGGAGLVFKGSGFYLTDYGKNAHRRAAPEAAKGDAKADGKPDATRPDAKADAPAGAAKPASEGGSAAGGAKSAGGSGGEGTSSGKGKGGDAT